MPNQNSWSPTWAWTARPPIYANIIIIITCKTILRRKYFWLKSASFVEMRESQRQHNNNRRNRRNRRNRTPPLPIAFRHANNSQHFVIEMRFLCCLFSFANRMKQKTNQSFDGVDNRRCRNQKDKATPPKSNPIQFNHSISVCVCEWNNNRIHLRRDNAVILLVDSPPFVSIQVSFLPPKRRTTERERARRDRRNRKFI